MRKYGLIGYPLGHSFSKSYFTEKFHNEHINDCNYENYPLDNLDKLPHLIAGEPELQGLNVTIPYKSQIIRFLDQISPEARSIGAVNVIKIRRENDKVKLSGFNSDVTGIRVSLLPYIRNRKGNAIVLGTGGSSRAVMYVLKESGVNVILVSREKKPGSVSYADIDSNLINSAVLIVNTTPLGMFPDIDSKPDLNYGLLNKNHILFDLVYNPLRTSFLKMGEEMGCITISGIKMLHSQAERAWQIWNDSSL
jgi:shikimate dehydrogenase